MKIDGLQTEISRRLNARTKAHSLVMQSGSIKLGGRQFSRLYAKRDERPDILTIPATVNLTHAVRCGYCYSSFTTSSDPSIGLPFTCERLACKQQKEDERTRSRAIDWE